MTEPIYVDGVLVDWGERLFRRLPPKRVRPQRGMTGVMFLPRPSKKSSKGAGHDMATGDAGAARKKLGWIVRRTPEVMVKISGGGKGMRQIKDHMDYISRNGRIELENEEGETIAGREALRELSNEWQISGGFQIPSEGTIREAFNVVFSMPAGSDPLAVRRAVREFAGDEFAEHRYVMAMHTFDTDPDSKPSRHPHVHIVVKARSFRGTRLNPRKADLQRWREGFAEALREHGVDAAATNRLQRLTRDRGERQAVVHMRHRNLVPNRVGPASARLERIDEATASEKQVFRAYKELATDLARSEDPEDRKLAIGIVQRLIHLLPEAQRNRSKDLER
jgi:hypothetical protein